MEMIALVDFHGDRGSVAVRVQGGDADEIYATVEAAFEAEGFDTITLFTPQEVTETWGPFPIHNLTELP